MSQEPDKQTEQEQEHLQHAAEHEKPGNKNHVMNYLVILFAAAFLLMLLSYFMQQRTNQEAMEGLKESVTTMTSVQDLIAQNDELEEQVKDLEKKVLDLEEKADGLQNIVWSNDAEIADLTKSISALDWLRKIQEEYALKHYKTVRSLIEAFEATDYVGYLPTYTEYQDEEKTILSPAEQYQAMKDAVN